MTFITSPVGLWNISGINSIIFQLPTDKDSAPISSYLTQFFPSIDSSSFSLIPELWDFSQDTFHRLMRRCVQLQSSLGSCHADLLADNSYRTWLGLTGRLFELSQKQRERVWDFGNQLCILMDMMAVLSVPSVPIQTRAFESILSSIDLCGGIVSQFVSFLGTPYQEPLLNNETETGELLHHLTSVDAQKTSEASLYSLLNNFSNNIRALQHSLLIAPEVRLMSRNCSNSPNKSVRVTVPLIDSILSVFTTLEHQSGTLSSDGWSGFCLYVIGTSGVPISIRHHLCDSLTSIRHLLSSHFDPHRDDSIVHINSAELRADECVRSARSVFAESTDLVR